jgi:hypothetical protein
MSSHKRKAEGSTLAHDDEKRKSTVVDQEQAVRPHPRPVRPPRLTQAGSTKTRSDSS